MTLIEVVLYLALFGMFFLVMVQFFFFLGDSNQLSGENMKIDRTMIYLSQHFEDTFKRGIAISEGEDGTVFGETTSGRLSLVVEPLPENQLDPTSTPVPIPTNTPLPPSPTPTLTPVPTATTPPTATPTQTPIPTSTFTPTPTFTLTPTFTSTPTPTNTPSHTPTLTPTATFTPTPTEEPVPTIVFVGANSSTTNSVTMPPFHQSGDLILVAAYRRNNTIPTAPDGWTTLGTHSGNSSAIRVAYKLAASGSETSGTWTAAEYMAVQIFRNHGGVGDWNINSANSTNINYPSLSLVNGDGSSWVAAFGGHDNASNVELAPTGMVNVTSAQATGELAAHNTNGGVASWTNKIVTVNSINSWKAASVEIIQDDGVLGLYDENIAVSADEDYIFKNRVLGEGTIDVDYTLADGILSYNGEAITRKDLNITKFLLERIEDNEDNLIGVKITVGISSRADLSISKELTNNYLLK